MLSSPSCYTETKVNAPLGRRLYCFPSSAGGAYKMFHQTPTVLCFPSQHYVSWKTQIASWNRTAGPQCYPPFFLLLFATVVGGSGKTDLPARTDKIKGSLFSTVHFTRNSRFMFSKSWRFIVFEVLDSSVSTLKDLHPFLKKEFTKTTVDFCPDQNGIWLHIWCHLDT